MDVRIFNSFKCSFYEANRNCCDKDAVTFYRTINQGTSIHFGRCLDHPADISPNACERISTEDTTILVVHEA